jgi:hypothetical protein
VVSKDTDGVIEGFVVRPCATWVARSHALVLGRALGTAPGAP